MRGTEHSTRQTQVISNSANWSSHLAKAGDTRSSSMAIVFNCAQNEQATL